MEALVGAKIGSYEIASLLGAGGMGEVYRARDVRLTRDVAIKVLSPAFRTDPDRLARLEREARLLASLNHPNIASIYELTDLGGQPALVMELVDGDTLAQRLVSGGRPRGLAMGDVLGLVRQLADALDAAHERGIIHRDLKPANLKITTAGTLKVLDFGLAKNVREEDSVADLSRSPTRISSQTSAGMILGTAAYMSPEQARGQTMDKRTDIWAFGCVLYEMLTGTPAFSGQTATDIFVNVLERQPDWSPIPATTPAAVVRLLRRCLEKDPRRRLHDIADARLDIDDALTSPGALSGAVSDGSGTRSVAFSRLTDSPGTKESPAISPDGKMVAFVAYVDGRKQIWIRMLSGGEPLQITRDATDHEQPRWAPDSSSLVYFSRSKPSDSEGAIWQISALGGPARRVAASLGGADISHDGKRLALFQPGDQGIDLVIVNRDGTGRSVGARLAPTELHRLPRWAPDDSAVAYQVGSIDAFDHRLEIVSLQNGERRRVARSETLQGFSWCAGGAGLVYASSRGSSLLYPPLFSLRWVDRDGSRDEQLTFGDLSYVDPDTDAQGRVLACCVRGRSDVWRFPVTGSAVENTAAAARITQQTGQVQTPSVSPDGSEVVYISDNGGHANLWVLREDGSGARQITFEHEPDVAIGVPVWSPSGEWINFIRARSFRTSVCLIRPDGSDLQEIVPHGWSATWSADGAWLYYARPHDHQLRHERVSIATRERIETFDTGFSSVVASASLDDQTLYVVNRRAAPALFGRWSGETEISRVREDGSLQSLVKVGGGRVPVSQLLLHPYPSPDGQWLALALTDGGTSNIFGLPTAGGPLQPFTDFGRRSTLIARSVSWSADSRSVYAALVEVETDVVLFDGLI